MFCKYFLPFHGLSFYSADYVIDGQKFYIGVIQFISFNFVYAFGVHATLKYVTLAYFILNMPAYLENSGHRTGKGPFSFQSQRKAMPQNARTTTQLHSSHMLVK